MATSPDEVNNFVGKGELYFDRLTAAGASTGERDLGNAPTFSVTPVVEVLEHFSSRTGIRYKDNEVDVSQALSVKFSLDEITVDNLCLALYGNDVQVMSQGDGNVGAERITLYHNRWVKLAQRNITVSSTGIAGYREGTDYTVDHAVGRIKALSTGSIGNGESANVKYTFGAMTWDYVQIFGRKPIKGLLRLIGTNDVGTKFEVVLWSVKFKNAGDINFISDDWNTIELEAEALSDVANHPLYPFGQVIQAGVDISGS